MSTTPQYDHRPGQVAGAWSTAIGIVVLYLLYGSEKDREVFLHGR